MKNRKNARVPQLRLRGYDALRSPAAELLRFCIQLHHISILCEPKIETTVLETLDLEDVKKLMSHEYLNSDLSCLGIRTLVSP